MRRFLKDLLRDVIPILMISGLVVADGLSGYDNLFAMNINGLAFFCINSFLWVGLLTVPMLILGRWSRYFYVPLFAHSLIVCALQWYARMNFGINLDGSVVGILLSSSSEEVVTFVKCAVTPLSVLGVLVLLAVAVGGVVYLWRHDYRPASIGSRICASILLSLFALWSPSVLKAPIRLIRARPMFNMWYDIVSQKDYYRNLQRLIDAPAIPETVAMKWGKEAPFMVFVLGESSARCRWSIYGYDRPTTEEMDRIRDELVVFSDVVGSAYTTADAMKMLFTEATTDRPFGMNCTFSQILKRAGYRCVLVSAQAKWDNSGSLENYMFSGCDQMTFLCEEGLKRPWYDDALLPYLDKEICFSNGFPTTVFLHLKGSHPPVREFYPVAEAKFKPEVYANNSGTTNPLKNKNHYDNSIAFTDSVLGRVVDRLRALNRPALMFYISDHGESVDSDHWRDVRDIAIWELPMICWMSKEFREAYPDIVKELEASRDRPLQSENLLPGLVSLFLVGGYGTPQNDFHNAEFCVRSRLIRGGKEEYKRVK